MTELDLDIKYYEILDDLPLGDDDETDATRMWNTLEPQSKEAILRQLQESDKDFSKGLILGAAIGGLMMTGKIPQK